jgi:hypothetical protein
MNHVRRRDVTGIDGHPGEDVRDAGMVPGIVCRGETSD